MASNVTITLPNPYTPLAFVPPEMERKFMELNYASVGSLAVFLWDIILHLPMDYKLATQFRINISFIIYCIARLASFAYVLGLVVVTTAPVGNCDLIRKISILYPFTIPLTTLLFVLRVCALHHNNKYVIAFFSVTWISVLLGCIAVPIGVSGVQIGTTKHCFEDRTVLVNALASSLPFVHDTFVFIATSWALMKYSYYPDVNLKNGIKIMVLGKNLPAFSKSILRDGQAYYLSTLLLNLFFIVLFYSPDAKIAPCTIGIPFFVILNNMSSYVYRNVRFGFYRDTSITTSVIDRAFQTDRQHHEIVFHIPTRTPSKDPTSTRVEEGGDLEAGGLDYIGGVTGSKSSRAPDLTEKMDV